MSHVHLRAGGVPIPGSTAGVLGLLARVGDGRSVRRVAAEWRVHRTSVVAALVRAREAGLVEGPDIRGRWALTTWGDFSLRTGIVQGPRIVDVPPCGLEVRDDCAR